MNRYMNMQLSSTLALNLVNYMESRPNHACTQRKMIFFSSPGMSFREAYGMVRRQTVRLSIRP